MQDDLSEPEKRDSEQSSLEEPSEDVENLSADEDLSEQTKTESEFYAFLESVRRLDEDEIGAFSPLSRQANKVWSILGHQGEATVEDYWKFAEVYWAHFMLQIK